MNNDTQVVILAGGKGKRMNNDVPKALTFFKGKPMIDYLIEAIASSHLELKPIVVVGYKKEDIVNHIGPNVIYAYQDEQLGTGHAVKVTKDKISSNAKNILVLYSDAPSVSSSMILNLVKTHKSSDRVLTMATVNVPSYEGWYQVFYGSFSRILRDEKGEIVRSIEFKDATDIEREIKEINPCYFCFDKEWLFEKLEYLKNNNSQGEYYLTDVVEYAAKEQSIASVSINPEEALGVNTIEELERLEKITNKKG